ncbi:hypothetical protein [Pseudomonas syringae]|uniref:hypothetical protein n=1 Tax=Pseudomonas syringae TaxID=317 RepID=UPI0002D5006B|nr:hypothetical protein [Pseudomonas syringae]
MHHSIPPQINFTQVMTNLGLQVFGFKIRNDPQAAAAALLIRIKLGGKLLSTGAHIPRMTALEHMARALGFADWHALQIHLNGAKNLQPSCVPEWWIERLKYALVPVISISEETGLSPAQVNAFEDFAQKLSEHTHVPQSTLLNVVCARYFGKSLWAYIRKEGVVESGNRLYSFLLLGPYLDIGEFRQTIDSAQLNFDVDEVYEEYESDPTDESLLIAKQKIFAILEQNPELIEAGLWLGELYYAEGSYTNALRVVNSSIKQANDLIPKGFHGEINWRCIGNRFYTRLYNLRMRIYRCLGRLDHSLRDARKLKRLSVNVDFGAAEKIPLILLQMGDFERAARSASAVKNGVGLKNLARAFCSFVKKDQLGFQLALFSALCEMPPLCKVIAPRSRMILLSEVGAMEVENYRQDLSDFVWPAYTAVPGLAQACRKFVANDLIVEAIRDVWINGAMYSDRLIIMEKWERTFKGRLVETR